jgi:uncharacterized cupin superfamily protein
MRRANLFSAELEEASYAAGFHHAATSVTATLGVKRIGAGLYEAHPNVPIWPYHYHHWIEEWLLVLSGTPVLREPAGRRELAAGDLIAFPSGRLGTHTIEGPGRFVVFSEGSKRGSVYPDSDKTSGPEGLMLRGPAVGYWYGEGTGVLDPDLDEREPLVLDGPPRPAVNLETIIATPPYPEAEMRDGFRIRSVQLGPLLGAVQLGATLCEVDPGEGTAPYHYEYGREEAVLILSGGPTLRHPDGEDRLEAGDLVCFPEGPTGAHRLLNRGNEPARLLFLSTTDLPAPVCYPDSGKWLLRNALGAPSVMLRESAEADHPD